MWHWRAAAPPAQQAPRLQTSPLSARDSGAARLQRRLLTVARLEIFGITLVGDRRKVHHLALPWAKVHEFPRLEKSIRRGEISPLCSFVIRGGKFTDYLDPTTHILQTVSGPEPETAQRARDKGTSCSVTLRHCDRDCAEIFSETDRAHVLQG